MVKKIIEERIIEEDENEKMLPRKIVRKRIVSYRPQSLFPLGIILSIVFVILFFIYYSSHRTFISGGFWSYVAFGPEFSIISWFYWVLVVLIAIIIWQMLD